MTFFNLIGSGVPVLAAGPTAGGPIHFTLVIVRDNGLIFQNRRFRGAKVPYGPFDDR